MDQLNGRLVVIVLSIQEGQGFLQSDKRYIIEANLNGRNIISDSVPADASPLFCTELIWEIEKKEIRKLRSSHVPLRVECFTIDSDNVKEKVGFVLLHLRTARPIPNSQVADVDYKWNKLLGVHPDWKQLHPEISLTLTIRDRVGDLKTPNTPSPLQLNNNLNASNEHSIEYIDRNLSIMYVEDGFIQIGESDDVKEMFTLSFLIETAFNLDLLYEDAPEFRSDDRRYHVSLSFFNIKINSKEFFNSLLEPVILNDQIMFKLNSNINNLRRFFEKTHIVELKLYANDEVLGLTEINLTNFYFKYFHSTECKLGEKYEQDCILKTIDGQTPQDQKGRKPFISTETYLDRDCPAQNTNKMSTLVQRFDNPCGDTNEKKTVVDADKSEVSCQTNTQKVSVCKSIFTTLKDVGPSNSYIGWKNFSIPEDEVYYLYCLTTTFEKIIFKKCDDVKNGFQFRFSHPKANTVLIVQCNADSISYDENILLENVICKEYLLSTPSFIAPLVYTYPPKVVICNSLNEKITEEFDLYTKLFLSDTQISTLAQDQKNCTYFAMIGDRNNEEDIICEIQINLLLTECVQNPENYIKTCYDLEPIILDERLAFRTLSELQKWKENQKERFEERQKCLENEKLKILKEEWEKKRVELERKLNHGIEKCRVLSEELLQASNELEVKKKIFETNLYYPQNPESIEIKVTQMMEQEMNEKLERMRKDSGKLLEHISVLEKDKQDLKNIIIKKDEQMKELKRTTLTKEQTSNLLKELRVLEEKYRQELNSKNFFKEQWQKAAREVHTLKSEDHKQIKMQLLKKKNELSQLSLENFCNESDSDHHSDTDQSIVSCPNNNLNSCYY